MKICKTLAVILLSATLELTESLKIETRLPPRVAGSILDSESDKKEENIFVNHDKTEEWSTLSSDESKSSKEKIYQLPEGKTKEESFPDYALEFGNFELQTDSIFKSDSADIFTLSTTNAYIYPTQEINEKPVEVWSRNNVSDVFYSACSLERKIDRIWDRIKLMQSDINLQSKEIAQLKHRQQEAARMHTVFAIRKRLEVYKEIYLRPSDFHSAGAWKNLSPKDRWAKLFAHVKKEKDLNVKFFPVRHIYDFLIKHQVTDINEMAITIETFINSLHSMIHNYEEKGEFDETFLREHPLFGHLARSIFHFENPI